jgi:flagellar biosynthesis/type III secretory pathway protein FliH
MINLTLQFDRPLFAVQLVSPTSAGGGLLTGEPVGTSIRPDDDRSDADLDEIEELLTQISSDVKQLQGRHTENLQRLKTMSVELAIMMVRKIVGSSEDIQTQRMEQLLVEALNRTEPAVGIHLHPQDLTRLEFITAKNASLGLRTLNVVADESIEAGECRIDYATYELTSSLAQQIEEFEHRLMEVVNEQ